MRHALPTLALVLALAPNLAAQGLDDLLDDLIEDSVEIAEPDPSDSFDDDLLDDMGLDDLLGEGEVDLGSGDGGNRPDALESWKGFVELRPRVYVSDRGEGRNDEQLLFEGEFEFDFRINDRTSAYFRPRVFFDGLDGDLKRFEPYEAYVTYKREDWDLRVGQFVENWGIVDTFNPIDVINRRDFGTDVLDSDRLGELGFRYRRFFTGGDAIGEPTLSLYALPVFRPTPFAPEDQRFGFGGGLDEDLGFEPSGLEQAFFAARYQSTVATPFADADVQVVVARGPERAPTFAAGAGASPQPVYFGVTTVGAGFRAVPNEEVAGRFLSTLTLKAEVVHKSPYTFDDSPIDRPDDYLTAVVGVDRGFYRVFSELDQVTMTVEYARETGANDPSALLRPFRNDLILRAFWEANDFERQSLEVRGLFDLDEDESIIELLYERQLRSIHPDLQLEVELRAFDVADPGTTFFSLFPNNSSVAIGLRWDF